MVAQQSSHESPFFLVGAHRSGTTLTGLMLDSHPDLSWFHDFDWAAKYIPLDGTWPTLEEYKVCLKDDFAYNFWNLDFDYGNPQTYPDVLDGFLKQRRDRDQRSLSGATVHVNFAELPKIWPHAKFLHLKRDPRDVAQSTIKFQWNGNAWGASQRWLEAELEWDKLCKIVPESQRLEFKFEDLIADPVDTLKQITEFLGIPYTEEIFSYIDRTPYSYPNPNMVYKWRDTMRAKDIEMVEIALGDLLTRRGYDKVSPKNDVSALKKWLWTVSDRFTKFRWRAARYGWKLWIAQFAARRLGYPSQLAWAIEQAQSIDVGEVQARKDFIVDPNTL